MTLRTPLKEVRHLGSAREGTDHFWKQRLTGVANVFLGLFLVWLVANLAGADQAAVKSLIAKPWISLPLALLVVSGVVHMKLGMQTIIEDYVHGEAAKISLLLLNTFFAVCVGAATILAVLKLSFGG
jgi:succinate dehydrogenase / fumarate reductase, membrane anchor subunit